MSNINITQLTQEVTKALQQYTDEQTKTIKNIITEEAEKCVENIKNDSPVNTGKYKKGWKLKKNYEDNLKVSYTIYNANKPQLTHLLENGYMLRNGERKEGKKHIANNEEKIVENIENRVTKELYSETN